MDDKSISVNNSSENRTTDVQPVLYLDTVTSTDFAKNYKSRTYRALEVKSGDILLDVGCGTGDDVIALAALVGSSGKVIGVDKNPTMIAEGWKRQNALGLPVEFRLADSHELPFPDNHFDGCRSDRAVQHMDDPMKAIAEMARVVREHGKVAVSEPDWDTLLIDLDNKYLVRKLIHFITDNIVRHGWIGRQLPRIFKAAGLKNISVSADSLLINNLSLAEQIYGFKRHSLTGLQKDFFTRQEIDELFSALDEAEKKGFFFCSAQGFMVTGSK